MFVCFLPKTKIQSLLINKKCNIQHYAILFQTNQIVNGRIANVVHVNLWNCWNVWNFDFKRHWFWISFWLLFLNDTKRQLKMYSTFPILTLGQFHQHSIHSFYVRKLRAQLFCAYILGLYFTGARLLAQKLCVERWWNWALITTMLYQCSDFFSQGGL